MNKQQLEEELRNLEDYYLDENYSEEDHERYLEIKKQLKILDNENENKEVNKEKSENKKTNERAENFIKSETWEKINSMMSWQVKALFTILIICSILIFLIKIFTYNSFLISILPSTIISILTNLCFILFGISALYLIYFFFYSTINLTKAMMATFVLGIVSFFVTLPLIIIIIPPLDLIFDFSGDSTQEFSKKIIIGIMLVSAIRFFYILKTNKNTRNSRFFWAIIAHIPMIMMMSSFTDFYSYFYPEETANVFYMFHMTIYIYYGSSKESMLKC